MIEANRTVRALTISSLRRAIRAGRGANYNRQAEDRLLEVADASQIFPAQLLLIHEYRRFKPCKPHARIGIDVTLGSGGTAYVILDVPLVMWDRLPIVATAA